MHNFKFTLSVLFSRKLKPLQIIEFQSDIAEFFNRSNDFHVKPVDCISPMSDPRHKAALEFDILSHKMTPDVVGMFMGKRLGDIIYRFVRADSEESDPPQWLSSIVPTQLEVVSDDKVFEIHLSLVLQQIKFFISGFFRSLDVEDVVNRNAKSNQNNYEQIADAVSHVCSFVGLETDVTVGNRKEEPRKSVEQDEMPDYISPNSNKTRH